jgi:hypothetical protein
LSYCLVIFTNSEAKSLLPKAFITVLGDWHLYDCP